MKRHLKFKWALLAIVVAIFATIAFSAHCDDTPFRPFARAFVNQHISSGQSVKLIPDLSTHFLGNTSATLICNVVSFRWKSGTLVQNPTLIFAESIPPFRGPPTAIPS